MSEENNTEVSAMKYVKVFFRRKEFLIIPMLIGLVAGICTGMSLPKKYVSKTTLLVEEGKTDNPLFHQLAISTTVSQRLSSIRESMLGWNSLVQLIKRLDIEKDIKTPQELESKISNLRRNSKIKMKGHNIIYLSHSSDDPIPQHSYL